MKETEGERYRLYAHPARQCPSPVPWRDRLFSLSSVKSDPSVPLRRSPSGDYAVLNQRPSRSFAPAAPSCIADSLPGPASSFPIHSSPIAISSTLQTPSLPSRRLFVSCQRHLLHSQIGRVEKMPGHVTVWTDGACPRNGMPGAKVCLERL